MLPAAHRLRHRSDITRVYRRGRFTGGADLSLRYIANHRSDTRAVIVVAKKVSKRAVVRNTIRRRLAERLRQTWETVEPGYDIVLTVHRDLSETPSARIAELLQTSLSRSALIR